MPFAGIVFGFMIAAYIYWQNKRKNLVSFQVSKITVPVFWLLMLLSALYAPFFGFLAGMFLSFICSLLVYQNRHHTSVNWEDMME